MAAINRILNSVGQSLDNLGVPVPIVTALILPILAAAVIAALRAIVLRLVRRRLRAPKDLRRWRRISLYIALVVAGIAFEGIWRASADQIADWVAGLTGADETTARRWFETGLSILFSTAALVLAVAIARAINRAATVRLRAWSLRTRAIRLQQVELVKAAQLRILFGNGLRLLHLLLLTAAALIYSSFVLSVYPATARWGAASLKFTGSVVVDAVREIIAYLPNLVYLIVIWTLAYYAVRALRFFREAVEKEEISLPNFEPDWADPTYKLLRVAITLFAMVVSYPYLPGAQSEVFRGFSVFLGALLTLGSTAVVGNVISGVVLTYTGSFHVGDRVRIGATTGDVLEKTLFVTRLRTVENEIVSIPNGVVLSGSVLNYNRMAKQEGLIVTVRVGIGYDVPWKRVHELLEGAAKATSHIVAHPPPTVWELSLDDYAVTYELRAATDQPARLGVIRAELHRSVLDAFNKAGVEIMTPSVHSVRDGSTAAIPAEYDPPVSPPARLRIELERIQRAMRVHQGARQS